MYIFLTTRNGTVKKSNLDEFENIRKNGIAAIKLDAGDELVWSKLTSGKDDILLITNKGMAIRFNEKSVRPTGRATRGVRGIKLKKEDKVIGMDLINETLSKSSKLLIVMANGIGKVSPVTDFKTQNRSGMGIKCANVNPKTGEVIFAKIVPETAKELLLTSVKGQVVKLPINRVPVRSRVTQGVILMRFSHKDDFLAAATCL